MLKKSCGLSRGWGVICFCMCARGVGNVIWDHTGWRFCPVADDRQYSNSSNYFNGYAYTNQSC